MRNWQVCVFVLADMDHTTEILLALGLILLTGGLSFAVILIVYRLCCHANQRSPIPVLTGLGVDQLLLSRWWRQARQTSRHFCATWRRRPDVAGWFSVGRKAAQTLGGQNGNSRRRTVRRRQVSQVRACLHVRQNLARARRKQCSCR